MSDMIHISIQSIYLAALAGADGEYPSHLWPVLRQQVPFWGAGWVRLGGEDQQIVMTALNEPQTPGSDRQEIRVERAGFIHVFVFLRLPPMPAFSPDEIIELSQLCTHAVCALDISYQIALRQSAQNSGQADQEPVGVAVVSMEGNVVSSDAVFQAHISTRQRAWDQRNLPFDLESDPRLPVQAMVWQGLFIRFDKVGADYHLRVRKDRRASELTVREHEIAERIARGLTFKEVAREMDLAPSTVSTHLYNVYDKIGVRRRADLQTWLKRKQS